VESQNSFLSCPKLLRLELELSSAVMQHAPLATISLEVVDKMKVKMDNLRNLNRYFASK
jgi:hypothetical protein